MATNEVDHDFNDIAGELGPNDDDIQPDYDEAQPGGSNDDARSDDDDTRSNDDDIRSSDGVRPNDEDIRREYHPNAHREPEVFSFDEYQSIPPVAAPPPEAEPWLPFNTREDFEFAEIALATAMTKAQVNATIDLLHRCIKKGLGSFTLSNHEDMRKTLKVAADRLPKVFQLCSVNFTHPDHVSPV